MPKEDEFLVDLDAERAARAEKRGDQKKKIRIGGKTYTLPDELPIDYTIATLKFQSNPDLLEQAFRMVFGESYDEIKLTTEDFLPLVKGLDKLYGGGASGELQGSTPS